MPAIGSTSLVDLEEIPDEVAKMTKMLVRNPSHLANLLRAHQYPKFALSTKNPTLDALFYCQQQGRLWKPHMTPQAGSHAR